PNLFAYTLPSAFLGEIALRFGCSGPTWITAPAGEAPWSALLQQAAELIESTTTGMVLVGFNESPVPAEIASAFPAGACFLLVCDSPGAKAAYATLVRTNDGWQRGHDAVSIPNATSKFLPFLATSPHAANVPPKA
ncbi:MAG: hypothetical protein D6820_17800, partial [Lentisphaerae bacterium]